MKIVETSQLTKAVTNNNNELTILKAISLEVHKGEFIAIMGPSGSGKSTLLNILGGLDTEYKGALNICNQQLNEMKEDQVLEFRRKHIGMIFQEFNLIETLSVRDNLRLPLLFARQRDKEEEKADDLLNLVGMYEKKNDQCSHLSGGEKQRIAIARAFMLEPELLLADEPTGALDSENGIRIMELMKNVNEIRNTTVILVTHDSNMASYSNRKIFLKDGKIEER